MEDSHFLRIALNQAKKSVEAGGFPAGAVIVINGEVISEGISIGNLLHDPTSHAETAAIRAACQKLQTSDLTGATLYESLECCNMCFSVSNWANISRIVYAARKTPELVKNMYYEGSIYNSILNENNNHKIDLIQIPELEAESLQIANEWEKALTNKE